MAVGRQVRPRGEICEVRYDPWPTGQGGAWAWWRSGQPKGRECAVGLQQCLAWLLKTCWAFLQLRGEGEKELAAVSVSVAVWRPALGGA